MSLPEARMLKWPIREALFRGLEGSGGSLRVLLAVFLIAPLLAGCGGSGFAPLHGSLGADGTSVADKLRSVDIAPIPGRVGQRVRNELIFDTTGGDHASLPEYRLEIAIRSSVASALVERTGESNLNIFSLDATFRLVSIKDKSVLLEGTSYGRAGFERFTSIFSNVRARRDAEDRAARTVATDMKSRIAAYLSSAA